MKNKITKRWVIIALCYIAFLIILLNEGFRASSAVYWILIACYTGSMFACFEEGTKFSEDSIKKYCGHSYLYLYGVYVRVKKSVELHKNKLMVIDSEEYEDEFNREIMRSINQYGLNISSAMLNVEEDTENEKTND